MERTTCESCRAPFHPSRGDGPLLCADCKEFARYEAEHAPRGDAGGTVIGTVVAAFVVFLAAGLAVVWWLLGALPAGD